MQGATSLGAQLLLSLPLFRRLLYETFLRLHQSIAVLALYSIWRHLHHSPLFPRMTAIVAVAVPTVMLVIQTAYFLFQNKAMGASLSRAYIFSEGDAVKVKIRLSRHIRIKSGQHIGLWIPAVSLWAPLQCHPFVVTSWSAGRQQDLELVIEPRKGWTRALVTLGKVNEKRIDERAMSRDQLDTDKSTYDGFSSHLALFTGPHGRSVPVAKFETVVMIASDFGVTAQLPYLEELMYGYNACKTRNRRIHLVWFLEKYSK